MKLKLTKRQEDKLLKYYFYFFCAFLLYIWFFAPQTLVSTFEATPLKISAFKLEIEPINDTVNYHLGECNLSFYSYKDDKVVSTPKRFFDSLTKTYSCEELQLLSKIAHYESEWGIYTQNPDNEYAQGIYMVLPKTRIDECLNKYGIVEEDQCALFVIENFPGWYLTGYAEHNYDKSFIF